MLFACWVAVLVCLVRGGRAVIPVGFEAPDLHGTNRTQWPTLTVIVPARDEEAAVGRAVASLADMDYHGLEVIAVDDRSTDRTGRILDEWAQARPGRIRAMHITELPRGWLGKNHANHVAAREAQGELLLFTDGDVVHGTDSFRRAVGFFMRRRLHHVAGLPDGRPQGFFERIVMGYFGFSMFLFLRPWRLAGSGRAAEGDLGVGAFNLVDAETYRRAGGHEPLRLEVVDDVKLGRLLSRHGARQGILDLAPHTWLRWAPGGWAILKGLEKNLFAGMQFSVLLTCLAAFGQLALGWSPWLLPWLIPGGVGTCAAVAVMAGLTVFYGTLHLNTRWGFLFAVTFPIGATAMAFAMLNSMFVTLRRRGVRWRDTFYTLEELRAGRFR